MTPLPHKSKIDPIFHFTSLLELIEIKPVIIIRVKNNPSIITANDNVLRVTGYNEARKTGHAKVDFFND